jgi:hypothetical protein
MKRKFLIGMIGFALLAFILVSNIDKKEEQSLILKNTKALAGPGEDEEVEPPEEHVRCISYDGFCYLLGKYRDGWHGSL